MKQVAVIAGPTGSGKDTLITEVIKRYPRCSRLITATTRAMRPGEVNGVHYHFFDKEFFLAALERGDILEYNYRPSLDTYYGTYRPELEKQMSNGRIVLAQVQMVGATYLKEHYGATTIFILPSSFEMLEKGIRARDPQLTDEEVMARLNIARQEVQEDAPRYDYHITNEEGQIPKTVDELVGILTKEGYNLDA